MFFIELLDRMSMLLFCRTKISVKLCAVWLIEVTSLTNAALFDAFIW